MTAAIELLATNIAPIIIVAAIGGLVQRIFDLDPVPLSRAIFYAFGPALVFESIVTTTISAGDMLTMGIFAVLLPTLIGAIAFLVSRLLSLDAGTTSAVVLVTMFLNAGNYALPLVEFAFGAEGLAWATIFFIVHALMLNSIAIFIASAGKEPISRALLQMLKVPAIYAIPLAFLMRTATFTLPLFIERSVELLGDASIPSMLFLLGMQIVRAGKPKCWGLISLVTVLRLVVSPLLGFPLARMIGLTGAGFNAGVTESAMPGPVMATVLATEFEVQSDLVTGAVLITTLLSPLTLTVVLMVLGA